MSRVRVLVVEDSLTVRRQLCGVLAADPDLVIAGEAANGKQAIEFCQAQKPDVITMDMTMPVMSGLSACEYIMAYCPTPILVVSSSMNRGELFKMYDALAAGAVDILEKPKGDELTGTWEAKFVAAVKLVAKIRVIRHPRASLDQFARLEMEASGPHAAASAVGGGDRTGPFKLVAIGASTGGPAALVEVLSALPPEFAPPVLLVMHIGRPFASAFADWLDGQTGRRVRWAQDGDRLESLRGEVAMAPPDQHLLVRGGRLRLTDDPERHSCRPSIDVLFESVARAYGDSAIACLLTGMGRDGAAGLLEVRRGGGRTIAQDEATAVVYGMPREAALIGAAEQVLPLFEIGPALARLDRAQRQEG